MMREFLPNLEDKLLEPEDSQMQTVNLELTLLILRKL